MGVNRGLGIGFAIRAQNAGHNGIGTTVTTAIGVALGASNADHSIATFRSIGSRVAQVFRLFSRRQARDEVEPGDIGLNGYRVFTRKYDEVVSAKALLHRQGLSFIAREAASAFRSRLAARIAGLTTTALLSAESVKPFSEGRVLITVLIDLSGSLRGSGAQLAVFTAEAIAAFADAYGAPLEILGFTTVDWRGKPVRTVWQRRGKPENPGRLCALRHVVFKEFDDRPRPAFDLLFAGEFIFRENVDGEAILWALARLRAATGTHRMLIHVSDGAPVDDSTLSCNPPDLLWNHLKDVIVATQREGDVSLVGIGIKHSVAHLNPAATEVQTFEDVEKSVIQTLAQAYRTMASGSGPELQASGPLANP